MTDIFISYSHKDEKWKDALQDHLQVLQHHGDFAVWDDRQIQLGDDWYPAISQAIHSARVAILLVSTDFLNSEFVRSEEIPKLLKRRSEDGLRVIPLIVRPCAWQTVPWLSALQGGTKDNFALSRYQPESFDLEEALTNFVIQVNHLLQASVQEEQEKTEAEAQERARLKAEQAQRKQNAAEEQEKARLLAEKRARRAEEAEKEQQRQQAAQQEKARQLLEKQALAKQKEQERKQAETQKKQASRHALHDARDIQKNRIPVTALIAVVASVLAGGAWYWNQQDTTQKQTEVVAPTQTGTSKPQVLKRLPYEPEMVTIPAGTFTMGCLGGRDEHKNIKDGCYDREKPAHKVTLKAFQIGKYEVTFDEWDACEKEGICIHADDEGWGRGKRPVINVSWDDIQVYIQWLNQKTGKEYRLPTEAEWEYAARANSETAYPWGNEISCDQANYYNGEKHCVGKTIEVNSYSPDEFGLYNTSGNVWEWVQDCWKGSYQGASVTGEVQQDCGSSQGKRVLRGGSWGDYGRYCRSAVRIRLDADFRSSSVGFRFSLGL